MEFLAELGLSIDLLSHDLIALLLAFSLALPIGWERGYGRHSTGFRTLPIVAMAACGIAMMLNTAAPDELEARARVLQGVITGVGFIGGGAIVKTSGTVKGLVTAASIWNAGAIGLAVGLGRANIAVALSAVNFFSLLAFHHFAPNKQEASERDARPKEPT